MMSLEIRQAAVEFYRQSRTDGMSFFDALRVLRDTFGLDLVAAKEIACMGDHGRTLQDTQAALIPALNKALAQYQAEETNP